ncbi:MAG: amidohydrolase family protein [Armatimonadota bacterium]|nr:amidohydrolase family protein [Armatimonadota bacterium]MDR7533770.1 amidohydrolase family protein [Armatimonadota bacterium]MDR7535760.1 amidohydrolase family protein [Armatimonadota bacterium]
MVVDFQHHFVPWELAERRGARRGERRDLADGGVPTFTLHDRLYDPAVQLRDMDAGGVDTAVLSCNLGWDAPLDDCRLINDHLAALQHRYPGRFVGLAHAPVLESVGLREIQRALDDLGLRGVAIASQVEGLPLDSPRLSAFYALAQAREVPIFVHPAMAPRGYALLGDYDLARILGRELDLQLAVARLIAGGVLEAFPGVTFVIAHFGGGIAAVKERLAAKAGRFGTLVRPFDEYFRRLYFDMAGFEGGPGALACALTGIEPDRLVFATDYPQDFTGATTQTGKRVEDIRGYIGLVQTLDLPAPARDAMLGRTAVSLLRLDG